MSPINSIDMSLTRRELLKAGALAVAAVPAVGPVAAIAQTPKRGGTLRLTFQADPLHFDPHQTLSFVTMVPLSFAYSRLVKVKAGPSVKPMTYPVEPDLAESWTQSSDTTYLFKLRKGVRWHNKPPVNGRELTADDVKYTYERFLTITGNPNKPVLEYILVPRLAGLDLDLDHREGMCREIRRPEEGRVGGRDRTMDARALGAQRQARLHA